MNLASADPDCATSTSVTSGGYNMVGNPGSTAGFAAPLDLLNVSHPKLGPLANHGGPTPTHALLPDSPAIDQGQVSLDWNGLPHSCDQRFYPRPRNIDDALVPNQVGGDGNDIGAYEFQPSIRLRIERDPPSGVRVCWPTRAGEHYELLRASAVTGPWVVVKKIVGIGADWCEPWSLNQRPRYRFFTVRMARP